MSPCEPHRVYGDCGTCRLLDALASLNPGVAAATGLLSPAAAPAQAERRRLVRTTPQNQPSQDTENQRMNKQQEIEHARHMATVARSNVETFRSYLPWASGPLREWAERMVGAAEAEAVAYELYLDAVSGAERVAS